MVSTKQLEEIRDGDNLVFKAAAIDLLCESDDSGEIELDLGTMSGSEASGSGMMDLSGSASGMGQDGPGADMLDLTMPSSAPPNPSSDSGLSFDLSGSATGISAFGGGASADAGETKLGEEFDDDLTLESVGSGSGLLDLTRESDDTSLGAELLEEAVFGDDEFELPANASGLFESPAEAGDTPVAAATAAAATILGCGAVVAAAASGAAALGARRAAIQVHTHLGGAEVVVGAGECLVDRLRDGSGLEQRLGQPLVQLPLRVARHLMAGGAVAVHHGEEGLALVLELLDDQRVVLVRLARPRRVVARDGAAAVRQREPALDRRVDVAHRLHRQLGRHHGGGHLDRGGLDAVLRPRRRRAGRILGRHAAAAAHPAAVPAAAPPVQHWR